MIIISTIIIVNTVTAMVTIAVTILVFLPCDCYHFWHWHYWLHQVNLCTVVSLADPQKNLSFPAQAVREAGLRREMSSRVGRWRHRPRPGLDVHCREASTSTCHSQACGSRPNLLLPERGKFTKRPSDPHESPGTFDGWKATFFKTRKELLYLGYEPSA